MYWASRSFARVLLSAWIMVCWHGLFGQIHEFTQFDIGDGLPSNYVYGVVEDRDGYIWAYSEKGISKFDGYEWQNFSKKDGLPDDDVHSMMVDSIGNLFGLCYSGQSFRIQQDSILELDLEGRFISSMNGKFLLLSEGFNVIQLDYELNSKKINLENFLEESIQDVISLDSISIIRVNQDHLLYIKNNHLFRFSFQEQASQHLTYLFFDSKVDFPRTQFSFGKYNMSSFKGALFLDQDFKTQDSILYNESFYDQFSFLNTFKDSQGNIWIGTRNSGLLFIANNSRNLRVTNQGIGEEIKSTLSLEDEYLIYGTDRGKIYIEQNQNITKLDISENKLHDINRFNKQSVIISNLVGQFIYSIRDDRIVQKMSEKTPFSLIRSDEIIKGSTPFKTLHFDPSKNIYIGQMSMSFAVAQKSNTKLFKEVYSSENRINLEVLDNGEVFCFEKSKLIFLEDSLYTREEKLAINDIVACYGKNKNTLYVASEEQGLFLWERGKQIEQKIADVPNIRSIRAVGDDIVFCTNYELYKIDRNNNLSKILDKRYIIWPNEINDFTFYQNQYCLATKQGLIKFKHPLDSTNQDQTNPNCSFTALNKGVVFSAKKQDFSHKEKDVAFQFRLTHYPSQDNIEYRYKLEPIEEHWKTTHNTSLSYIDLKPNQYRFEVYGKTMYGNEFLVGQSSFTIHKAWFQTWWFYLTSFILLITGLYFLISWRQRSKANKVIHEVKVKQQMADLKLSALKSQMNPHFIFNALGSIQYYIQTNEQDLADEYLSQFATLIRMYLDVSKEHSISISNELELLQHYIELEQMRFDKLFEYEFHIDPILDVRQKIPSMLLQPLAENAINHGLRLRKDGKGKLDIAIQQIDSTQLEISVTDNGIGMLAAKRYSKESHTSHANRILKEKIEVMKEQRIFDISITYTQLSDNHHFPGTKVSLSITPLKTIIS